MFSSLCGDAARSLGAAAGDSSVVGVASLASFASAGSEYSDGSVSLAGWLVSVVLRCSLSSKARA